jgi:hypothetical protein
MSELFLPAFIIMGAIFILSPILGLIPTILFFSSYLKLRRWPILLAAILWAVYTLYEYLMHARVLCSGECNIRVDLLAIYPLLLVLSIIAIVSIIRGRRNTRAVKHEDTKG